jgi:Tfp pilus assembly protein PilN
MLQQEIFEVSAETQQKMPRSERLEQVLLEALGPSRLLLSLNRLRPSGWQCHVGRQR